MIGLVLDLAALVLVRLAGQRPREHRQKLLQSPPARDVPSGRVITPPEPIAALRAPYSRTCVCGTDFDGRNPRKLYCSTRCKHAAHRERQRAKATPAQVAEQPKDKSVALQPKPRICPTCGGPVIGAPNKIFCGSGCHPSRPRAKIATGEAAVAGEDLGIKVQAPPKPKRRARGNGQAAACKICFGPTRDGEYCDDDCRRIGSGIFDPDAPVGRLGIFGQWEMAPSLRAGSD